MIEVTKDEFFAAVGPVNCHPRTERDHSSWEMLDTRKVIGRSEPGYMRSTGQTKRYWLTKEFAAQKIDGAKA